MRRKVKRGASFLIMILKSKNPSAAALGAGGENSFAREAVVGQYSTLADVRKFQELVVQNPILSRQARIDLCPKMVGYVGHDARWNDHDGQVRCFDTQNWDSHIL